MNPVDIEFRYVQDLALGSFAILLPSKEPILISEIAPALAGEPSRVMPLTGSDAFHFRDRNPYLDVAAMTFPEIRFEVDPKTAEQLALADGIELIGCLFVTTKNRGIYAAAGVQGVPKAIGFGGQHVPVPSDGLLFREWSIVSGAEDEKIVHWSRKTS